MRLAFYKASCPECLPRAQQHVAKPAQRRDQSSRRVEVPAVLAVGPLREAIEFVAPGAGDQPLAGDHAHEHTHGERSAAEAEPGELVARLVVGAGEGIEVPNVSLQSPPEPAAEDRQRLERGSANAIVVTGDLLAGGEVKRLVQPPDVRLHQLGGAVPRAVRQQHDVLGTRHGGAPARFGFGVRVGGNVLRRGAEFNRNPLAVPFAAPQ